jgi:hypothetical protein
MLFERKRREEEGFFFLTPILTQMSWEKKKTVGI